MALEIHIFGPGLETVRQIRPGETELILGRDVDCSVCLPDPERAVSRRHLAVWNEGGALHFRVLSSVNGVDMAFGYSPPGAKGVLPAGEVLKIGQYALEVRSATPSAAHDPWAVFDRAGAISDATLPRGAIAPPPKQEDLAPVITPEEDPFGDWGFESTFGPGSGGSVPKAAADADADASEIGDLSSFYKGLGLDATKLAALSPAEFETAGRAVRVALEGLFALYASRPGVPAAKRDGSAALVPVKDNNPLKTQWPDQTKLQYLFGGRIAGIGFVSPQRALTDVVSELLAHEAAQAAATRAALEATVQDFAPAALKERLLGGGSKLFEATRVWDAYARYYADKSQGMGEWVQQLLDRHFTEAYLRESQRIKRETGLNQE